MSIAIKVENLSKAYQLGDFGTGTISRDLERFWARIRGLEDPFLKIGEVNDRSTQGNSDIVWSLNNLNFEVQQGDAIGVIGRNGAGKSTLLKILSRVTSPTAGCVKIKGRIAGLLEVGTGFHPELTGRENIFLNGAILGMRKTEIKRKFDEIVDFAGVERYIDTPVKRYSSGMYVRLAFAVAAHLESEILIVDEVLAVGDAEFQKKCVGKMGDVSRSEGRTILFVSHNMATVREFCKRGILLEHGKLKLVAPMNEVIDAYISSNARESVAHQTFDQNPADERYLILRTSTILNQQRLATNTFSGNDSLLVRISFSLITDVPVLRIVFKIVNNADYPISGFGDFFYDVAKGEYEVECGEMSCTQFNTQTMMLKMIIDSPGNFGILPAITISPIRIENTRPQFQYREEIHNDLLTPRLKFNLKKTS